MRFSRRETEIGISFLIILWVFLSQGCVSRTVKTQLSTKVYDYASRDIGQDNSSSPMLAEWEILPEVAFVNEKVKIICVLSPGKNNRIVDWKLVVEFNASNKVQNEGRGAGYGENVTAWSQVTFSESGYARAFLEVFYQNADNPEETLTKTIDLSPSKKKK